MTSQYHLCNIGSGHLSVTSITRRTHSLDRITGVQCYWVRPKLTLDFNANNRLRTWPSIFAGPSNFDTVPWYCSFKTYAYSEPYWTQNWLDFWLFCAIFLSIKSRKHFPWTTSSSLSSTIIVPFSLFLIICIWWYCPSSTRWEYFKTTGPPPTSNCNFGRPSSCKRVFSITDIGEFQILIRENVKFSNFKKILCAYNLALKMRSTLKFRATYGLRGRRYWRNFIGELFFDVTLHTIFFRNSKILSFQNKVWNQQFSNDFYNVCINEEYEAKWMNNYDRPNKSELVCPDGSWLMEVVQKRDEIWALGIKYFTYNSKF